MKIKPNDILKYIFIVLIIIFLFIYASHKKGFYAYTNYEKAMLTEEAIKKFEEDVALGKDIDVNDYLKEQNNYHNKLSDTSLKISNTLGRYIKKGIIVVFKKVNKLIE